MAGRQNECLESHHQEGGRQAAKMSSPLVFWEHAGAALQYSPQKAPTVPQISGAGNLWRGGGRGLVFSTFTGNNRRETDLGKRSQG